MKIVLIISLMIVLGFTGCATQDRTDDIIDSMLKDMGHDVGGKPSEVIHIYH